MMTCTHLAAVRSRVNSGHSGLELDLTRGRRRFSIASETTHLHNDWQIKFCVVSPFRRAELVDGIPPTKPTYRRKTTNRVKTSPSDRHGTGHSVETRLAPKRCSAIWQFSRAPVWVVDPRKNPYAPVRMSSFPKNAVPGSTGRTARRLSENIARQGRAAGRVTHASNAFPFKRPRGRGKGFCAFHETEERYG